jgi:hypothetical protein
MKYKVIAILFIGLVFLGSGCKKEGVESLDCDGFRKGIVANDEERVKKSIAGLLGTYSQENINKLAAAIADQCTATATVDCFECIKTLPPQTEIIVLFNENGTTYRKLLDISYTPQNRMKMVAMHE